MTKLFEFLVKLVTMVIISAIMSTVVCGVQWLWRKVGSKLRQRSEAKE